MVLTVALCKCGICRHKRWFAILVDTKVELELCPGALMSLALAQKTVLSTITTFVAVKIV